MFLFFFYSNFKKCNNFCQILTQELDFAVGTRPDTKLCQILDQELKALPGTRTSSSGTKLSTLFENLCQSIPERSIQFLES